ncbi:MAG TPA: FliH/SctL family protein [Bryobacteraceae bacterium]
MSSRLLRGDQIPHEPLSWMQVGPLEPPPQSSTFPAVAYPPIEGTGGVGQARVYANPLHANRQQGFEEGQQAARQEAARQLDAMHQQLARTIEELSGARRRFRHEAEEDMVALAIAIARRILHRELTVAPEAVLGLLKAALDKMDAREIQRVRVSRLDAPMVAQHLEKMGLPRPVEVVADPSLPRGAAVLESSRGTLDASVETQLAEIERGFADLVRRA